MTKLGLKFPNCYIFIHIIAALDCWRGSPGIGADGGLFSFYPSPPGMMNLSFLLLTIETRASIVVVRFAFVVLRSRFNTML